MIDGRPANMGGARIRRQIITDTIIAVRTELETGISLARCQQCGCMEGALANLTGALPALPAKDGSALAEALSAARDKMRPVRYACLGCTHCYPAVAQNAFGHAFPALDLGPDLSCEFRLQGEAWPPVVGEYFVLDKTAPIAVSTLASPELAQGLADLGPHGLALVGKTETENIGIDKIVKNVISSPTMRYLILAGVDGIGHWAGQTLLSLADNGIDEYGRVIGSSGKRPVLRNVTHSEIETFRAQVQLIDMIGCKDLDEIGARVMGLSPQIPEPCG
jgi:tetrahydromethanopterin S-methyltransferase subunit A